MVRSSFQSLYKLSFSTVLHPNLSFVGIALILFVNATAMLWKKKKLKQTLNLPIFFATPILFFFSTLVRHLFFVPEDDHITFELSMSLVYG
jgi:uncharacterized membrane protein YesL